MPIQYIYWGIVIAWLIFGFWQLKGPDVSGRFWGNWLIPFALFFLIGLRVFGDPIK